MKNLFLPEVKDHLFELIEILYNKEYFGFKESAINYIIELKQDIRMKLPSKLKRPASSYFDRFDKRMLYAVFDKNKKTL